MYDGKLQGWQLDAESSDSLTSKVCYDIAQAITNETDMATGLELFIKDLKRKVMVTGTIDWTECPDESFIIIWKHKQQCLFDLYQLVTNVYSCHIPNNYFSDMYREKFEQSLDFLTDQGPAPLVDSLQTKEACTGVLEQRSKWGGLMKLLEDYRIEGKHRIIKATTIASASNALDVIRDELLQELLS